MNGRSFPGHFKTCPTTDLGIILCPSGISCTGIFLLSLTSYQWMLVMRRRRKLTCLIIMCRLTEIYCRWLSWGAINLSFRYTYTAIQFDVWILKDRRGQNWQRSYSIFADSISYLLPHGTSPIDEWKNALPNFVKLTPVCSLRNGEVIVFKQLKSLWFYLYDTKTKELRKLSELSSNKDYTVLPYKSSLVYWQDDAELLAWETI